MGSKARESTKAVTLGSLAFVLLDFQQKSIVWEMECRHVAVQKGQQDQNHS